jgi:adenylylsulfate kinase
MSDKKDGRVAMPGGFTLWLTGLSGSGKTTLAHSVTETLRERGVTKLEILDGDVIRTHLTKGLGFSRDDRDTNVRRIAYIAELLTRNGVVVIVAAISPYRDAREYARKHISSFVEVFVKCPLSVLVERDTKGLYRKALAGEIDNFTGISDPYEEPRNPEVTVQTDQDSIDESTRRIVSVIESLGRI